MTSPSKYWIESDGQDSSDIQAMARMVREHLGLSQHEVARDLNLNADTIKKYEEGTPPRLGLKYLQRLTAHYKLKLSIRIEEQ